MFGPEKSYFRFENSVQVDAGDAPPTHSSPSRRSSLPFARTKRIQPLNSRQSLPARLIPSDLEYQLSSKESVADDDDHTALTAQPSYDTSSSYDPYDDECDVEPMEDVAPAPLSSPSPSSPRRACHSLPTIEEARSYAATLLYQKRQSKSQREVVAKELPSSPTGHEDEEPTMVYQEDQFDSPESKHSLRKQLSGLTIRVCVGLCLFLLALFMVLSVTHKQKEKDAVVDDESTRMSQLEAAMNFLVNTRVSRMDDLLQMGSPQNLALKWMIWEDAVQRPVPDALLGEAAVQFVQRYALAVFYFATGGPTTWDKQLGFLSASNECDWNYGSAMVDFANVEYPIGVTCNEENVVSTVFIPSNGLTGSLPPEFFELHEMTLMALPNNALEQEFDVVFENTMRKMVQLKHVDWKYNRFYGTIPQILGTWENLKVLALSNNNFRGSLPSSLSNLERLKTLALDDNELTGPLNVVTDYLIDLEYFYADRNQFVHLVDDDFAKDLVRLRALDLSHNALYSSATQSLPEHFFNHPSLKILDLAFNDLSGELPSLMQRNNVLRFLSLRGNELHGSISAFSLPRLERLVHLDIQENRFTGKLPSEMQTLKQLNYLAFGNNDFLYSEGLPDWIWSLNELLELSAPGLAISGELPSNLDTLVNLVALDLSGNRFTGDAPMFLWDSPHIAYMLLHDNALDENVFPSETIMAPERLKVVTLYGNEDLSGSLEHVCDQASELRLLAADCSIDCPCCAKCCDTPDCFKDDVEQNFQYYEGLWEFDFRRADYTLDPTLLDDSSP